MNDDELMKLAMEAADIAGAAFERVFNNLVGLTDQQMAYQVALELSLRTCDNYFLAKKAIFKQFSTPDVTKN